MIRFATKSEHAQREFEAATCRGMAATTKSIQEYQTLLDTMHATATQVLSDLLAAQMELARVYREAAKQTPKT